MTLARKDGRIEGSSEPLDEAQFFPLKVTGRPRADGAELDLTNRGDPVGRLSVSGRERHADRDGNPLRDPGKGHRHPARRAPAARPVTHDFVPTRYHLQYSGRVAARPAHRPRRPGADPDPGQ